METKKCRDLGRHAVCAPELDGPSKRANTCSDFLDHHCRRDLEFNRGVLGVDSDDEVVRWESLRMSAVEQARLLMLTVWTLHEEGASGSRHTSRTAPADPFGNVALFPISLH